MIEIFDGSDTVRLAEVREFRESVFIASRRDSEHRDAWCCDAYDQMCLHVVARTADHGLVAAIRMVIDGRWPLEDRCAEVLDKTHGAEFGRLATARRHLDGQRTSYELMAAAARYCVAIERPLMYGLVIEPFWNSLRRARVPMQVLSATIEAYGESENVILFRAPELIEFHERQATLRAEPKTL
jgi:hypothetical protein